MADPERILLARLDGTAGHHAMNDSATDVAVAALRAITTDPNLLGHASGTALGAWRADTVSAHWGRAKSRLLDAAGADPAVRDAVADQTRLRLTRMGRGHSAP